MSMKFKYPAHRGSMLSRFCVDLSLEFKQYDSILAVNLTNSTQCSTMCKDQLGQLIKELTKIQGQLTDGKS
jgi:hypothetical protein